MADAAPNPAEHLGLVRAFIARNRWLLNGHCSFEEGDLISEGWLALRHAADKWDPARGAWTTCAMLYIRQRLTRYYENHARTVRVPSWAQNEARKAGETLPLDTAEFNEEFLVPTHPPCPAEALDTKRLQSEIRDTLIRLDRETRDIVRARIVHGNTFRDAAKPMGRSGEWARLRAKAAFDEMRTNERLAAHAAEGEVA